MAAERRRQPARQGFPPQAGHHRHFAGAAALGEDPELPVLLRSPIEPGRTLALDVGLRAVDDLETRPRRLRRGRRAAGWRVTEHDRAVRRRQQPPPRPMREQRRRRGAARRAQRLCSGRGCASDARRAPLRAVAAAGLLLAARAGRRRRAPQPSEDAVKAAFLTKFARYVAWPAARLPAAARRSSSASSAATRSGRLLDQRRARPSRRRPQRRRPPPRLGRARPRGCHIAFVQGGARADTAGCCRRCARQPVLTVTDARAGARSAA